MVYYFIIENDFISDGERDYFYFIINIIIAVIISFFGFVFNEFIVLSFCGLDYETHFSISNRALNLEKIEDLKLIIDDEDENFNGE